MPMPRLLPRTACAAVGADGGRATKPLRHRESRDDDDGDEARAKSRSRPRRPDRWTVPREWNDSAPAARGSARPKRTQVSRPEPRALRRWPSRRGDADDVDQKETTGALQTVRRVVNVDGAAERKTRTSQ